MNYFEPGDRIVIKRPNGLTCEPVELRGVVVSQPAYQFYYLDALALPYVWVRLDGDTPEQNARYFLADYVEHMSAVDQLAELSQSAVERLAGLAE